MGGGETGSINFVRKLAKCNVNVSSCTGIEILFKRLGFTIIHW